MAALAGLALLLTAGILGPEQTSFADSALYESVVERLFAIPKESRTYMRFRYVYWSHGEMQIIVRDTGGGAAELELWRLPSGSKTIWDQLSILAGSVPNVRPEDAVSKIRIVRETKSVKPNSALSQMLGESRQLRIAPVAGERVLLEAATYQFNVKSPSLNLEVSLQGPQDWRKSPDQLIRWIGRIREAVEKLPDVSQ
jgi:hypothetical protein